LFETQQQQVFRRLLRCACRRCEERSSLKLFQQPVIRNTGCFVVPPRKDEAA